MDPKHRLASRRDAAQELGVSTRTVDRMINDGQLPVVRVRGRVLIRADAVDEIISTSGAA